MTVSRIAATVLRVTALVDVMAGAADGVAIDDEYYNILSARSKSGVHVDDVTRQRSSTKARPRRPTLQKHILTSLTQNIHHGAIADILLLYIVQVL